MRATLLVAALGLVACDEPALSRRPAPAWTAHHIDDLGLTFDGPPDVTVEHQFAGPSAFSDGSLSNHDEGADQGYLISAADLAVSLDKASGTYEQIADHHHYGQHVFVDQRRPDGWVFVYESDHGDRTVEIRRTIGRSAYDCGFWVHGARRVAEVVRLCLSLR